MGNRDADQEYMKSQPHSQTSIAAAEAIEPVSGTLRAEVLAYLRSVDGATDEQIQSALGMNPQARNMIQLTQSRMASNRDELLDRERRVAHAESKHGNIIHRIVEFGVKAIKTGGGEVKPLGLVVVLMGNQFLMNRHQLSHPRGKTYQALASLVVGESLYLNTSIERDTYQKCANRYGIRVTTLKIPGVGWRIERIK